LEALGLCVEALVPEHLKDQHRAGIARDAETGHGLYVDSPRLLELRALTKGGEEIYIELSLSPIGLVDDADSDERYVLAIVRDITKRKRAEEQVRRVNEDLEKRVAERTEQLEVAFSALEERERGLRESEEHYRSFIKQSTEGIWRFELEEPVPTDLAPDEQIECFYRHTYLAECNDAMARMYGCTRAEEIVSARLDKLLPRSVQENVGYLRAFVRSGYLLSDAESQEVDRHGSSKYFLNNLAGTVEDGFLVRAWGTQRDITEQKKNEEAVKQSELLYHTVIEQATENIFLVDAETRHIVESNPAFQATLCYTEEQLRSMTLYDIVAADRKSIDHEYPAQPGAKAPVDRREEVPPQGPLAGERRGQREYHPPQRQGNLVCRRSRRHRAQANRGGAAVPGRGQHDALLFPRLQNYAGQRSAPCSALPRRLVRSGHP
jgi:PAS domain S-box-containing protein